MENKMVKTTNIKYKKFVDAKGVKHEETYYEEKQWNELANNVIVEMRKSIKELEKEMSALCPGEGYGIAYQQDKTKVIKYNALREMKYRMTMILANNFLLHEE
jgi:hypothetical protein